MVFHEKNTAVTLLCASLNPHWNVYKDGSELRIFLLRNTGVLALKDDTTF